MTFTTETTRSDVLNQSSPGRAGRPFTDRTSRGRWRGVLGVLMAVAIMAPCRAFPAGYHCGLNLAQTAWRQVGAYNLAGPVDVVRFWPAWSADTQSLRPPDLDAIRRAGFDFVRIPVEPAPLLGARSPAERRHLVDALVGLAQSVSDAGLATIVTMAPSNSGEQSVKRQVVDGGPVTAEYLDVVTALAGALQDKIAGRGGLTLFELLNEPTPSKGGAETERWLAVQRSAVSRLRRVAPTLPILLMSDDYASIDGLERLDFSDYAKDPNVWVALHFYEPPIITAQGAAWSHTPVRYLDRIPYPAPFANVRAVEGPSDRAVAADRALSPADKEAVVKTLHSWIAGYLRAHWNAGRMRARFDQAGTWADRNGLDRRHVIVDELGIIRRSRADAPGPDDSTRAAWLADVTRAAAGVGFGWAVWSDVRAFGIEWPDGHGFEPDITEAIFRDQPACGRDAK